MPDRKHRRSRSGRTRPHAESVMREATIGRGQVSRQHGVSGTGKMTGNGTRPTITLKDGSVIEAWLAATVWEQLKDLLREEPPEVFQSLLALAQGREGDANPQHLGTLAVSLFVNEGDHSIDPVVQSVLLNSYVTADTGPGIAPLRLMSAADKVVAEEALAQLHQQVKEHAARARSPGGFLDTAPWKKGKGYSLD